jgi:lipoyl(octanoyl) transferase
MQACVQAIKRGQMPEQIWYLEHHPVYTRGQRMPPVPHPLPFPVIATQRGGQWTYHGPGQCVVYVMINLHLRHWHIHDYVRSLEQWVIDALSSVGIKAHFRPEERGVWTEKGKIASVGIKVTSGITWHGIACNVNNDLRPFDHIVSCGVPKQKMTSVVDDIPSFSMQTMHKALHKTCPFGHPSIQKTLS